MAEEFVEWEILLRNTAHVSHLQGLWRIPIPNVTNQTTLNNQGIYQKRGIRGLLLNFRYKHFLSKTLSITKKFYVGFCCGFCFDFFETASTL